MNESLLLLIFANVLVLALLVLVLLFSRLHWGFRLFLVVIVSASYWVVYQGWDRAQGWPSTNALPDKFLLHGAVIEEPNKEKSVTGEIFIWATDLSTHQPADNPRAYVMPYSKKLHSAAQEALRQMRNGELQLGTVKKANEMKQVGDGYAGEIPNIVKFSNLPKQALPEK